MNAVLEQIGFYNSLNNTLKAVILLLLALIIALIVKAIVRAILKKAMSVENKELTEEMKQNKLKTIRILSNLTFAVVFIVFLPGALEKLGLLSVTAPISSMGQEFLNFLPNIIAAALIITFGIFLARFVRELVAMGLKKTKLDSVQDKCGIKDSKYSLSDYIAGILYAFLMIIAAVAAIKVLNLEAISEPATSMVNSLFNYIPLLFAACVLIIFGIFLGNLVGNLIGGALAGTSLNEAAAKLFPKKKDGTASDIKASSIIAAVIKIVIDVMFVISGVKILQIDVLTQVGTTILDYLPNILAAVIIMIIAWICANKASEAIINANPDSTGLAITAKVAIFAFAAFMAVQQLGIATVIVNILFGCIAGAGAVAFAIAFGVGGRSWAAKKLEEMDDNIKKQIKK